ncbi:MAG: hypothetical protein EOO77_23075 [Oxalobacteraceae bacterium]|nr:MAG: hypothetical protein EOO77_23075 [Oxalobacteraceae bacterium]
MKSALVMFALLASQSAFACYGEAQIIAIIQTTAKSGQQSCKAYVNQNLVQFFASSAVCPLDLSAIANEGVEVGMINGPDCAMEAGQTLNGVIVRNGAGVLRLE